MTYRQVTHLRRAACTAGGMVQTHNDRSFSPLVAAVGLVALGATATFVVRRLTTRTRDDSATGPRSHGVRVERVTTINKPIDEVYRFWRAFENFPRFMRHLEEVRVLDARRSRWVATGPAGRSVGWDAEILEDRPNEWIAWRSLPGSQVENSGSVRFSSAPGARGTEVRVQLQYSPPAGWLGRNLAWLFGEEPEQQIHEDLRRFKQLLETGEIPLSDGPGLSRPAQPAANPNQVRSIAGVRR